MGGCTSKPLLKSGSLGPIQEPEDNTGNSPLELTIDKATDRKITKLARKRGF
jgi:hypothetical protein